MDLTARLTAIFREVFDEPALVFAEDLGPRNVANWNSFTFLNLILRLEEEFGVELPPDRVEKVNTAGDVLRLVAGVTGEAVG